MKNFKAIIAHEVIVSAEDINKARRELINKYGFVRVISIEEVG